MVNFYYYLSLYLFIVSCYMYSFYYKHLMLMIISLEFIVISVVFNMFIIILNLEGFSFLMLFLLTFSVCEGALVLSLVVLMVRMYGNDYINSLSMLKW